MLLLSASIDALKNTERSSFCTGVQITVDLGIAPGRGRRPIEPEIVEVTVDMIEIAGRYVRSWSS